MHHRLFGFRLESNPDPVFVFLAIQKSLNFHDLERFVLPTSASGLREGVLLAVYKPLNIADRVEQRRLAASVRAEQQLLPLRSVFEVYEAAEVVDIDASQHG